MTSPLSEFKQIGPRTSLYTPSKPEAGQLIILCTWLGAGRKHIAKYTSLYQQLAPGSRILLVQSAVPILISSYAHQRKAIQSAVSVILDTLSECVEPAPEAAEKLNGGPMKAPEQNTTRSSISSATTVNEKKPKIMLHPFSNGGTNTATQMLIVLRRRLNAPLPLAGLLCDSCPAQGTYWKSYDAMVLSLPKDVMSRMFGALACHCILILLYSWIACGNENPASLQRRTLLDTNTSEPGWAADEQAPVVAAGRVCYLFSRSDRMCLWTDVVEHAEEARAKGWQVEEIMFEQSGHCAHLSKNESQYVDAVNAIWQGTGDVWTKSPVAKL